MPQDKEVYRVLVFREHQIDLHSKWVNKTLRASGLEEAIKLVEGNGGRVIREECKIDPVGMVIIITVHDAMK